MSVTVKTDHSVQCVYIIYDSKHMAIDIQHVIITLSLHTYHIHNICAAYNNKIPNQ